MLKKEVEFNKKRIGTFILVLSLLFAGIGNRFKQLINYYYQQGILTSVIGKNSPNTVKTVILKPKIVKVFSEFVGTIEAKNILTLKSEINGKIKQISIKEGDYIKKNHIIMQFDSSNLQAKLLESQARLTNTKARLLELKAGNRIEDLEEAEARLRGAQIRLNNTTIGDSVEEIAQARAHLRSSKASLELAQQRVTRYKTLKEQGVISIDEYQEHITILRRARADLEQTKRRLSQLKKRRLADLDELTTVVEMEIQNLQRLKTGPRQEVVTQAKADVIEASAQLQVSKINISQTSVVAPLAGVVENVFTRVSDYVKIGDPLINLINNDTVSLNLAIPLKYNSRLNIGLPVEIVDNLGNTLSKGEISFISSNIIKSSQSILIRVDFNKPNQGLLNGQFVKARVIWHKKNSLLIPANSVYDIGEEKFAFIVKNGSSRERNLTNTIAKRVKVQLNNLQGDSYQVINGLNIGDQLIISKIRKLKDGEPIKQLNSYGEKAVNH
ncbi:efflux RND transporter periplasmic adaptor subunit [Candidatus Atelocyanobacterium thalassae]|uniref:Multidrug resistance protein MdtA n=1 Tax=cyanobacterium endosymbiont of Braarudosphaera bigelowii TaxID=1285375 RepID=A0ABN6K0N4_9CHRO|nr:efflux RND transporter periplasmic adaptor subunit [Candidatus Atelocyanobacterium thalassa]BDA40303.1 multidrug resistance protein MdtA [cyanobacterium endosymbiont of Braarudosphaera bigelowii]